METIEKRLANYKGYQVWKVTDNKGLKTEKITYMLTDNEDNTINCFTSLIKLKKYVDRIF